MHTWKRTYWAVWASNLVTAVGMMSFLPFFPSHLEGMGLRDPGAIATWTGVIFGAAPFMAALMGPLWGALGDRIGRKLMVLRALVAIAFFVGWMGFAETPLQLLLLRLGQGVFSGFIAPSIALVSVAAPADRQGRTIGSLQTALAVGTILGPAVGAGVVATLGLRAVFFLVSAANLLSALVVLAFAREDPASRAPAPTGPPAPATGEGHALAPATRRGHALVQRELRLVGGSARLRRLLLLLFTVQFGVGASHPQMELFVRDVWSGDPSWVPGLTAGLFVLVASTGLVALPLWGRYGDRRGHGGALLRCSFASAAAMGLHALASGYALLLLARGAVGAAVAGTQACSLGLVAQLAPVERRGTAIAAVLSARQLAVSTAAMAGGACALAGALAFARADEPGTAPEADGPSGSGPDAGDLAPERTPAKMPPM